MEELAFRAYPFITLNKTTGLRVTQIIVAIMFALYHFAGGQSLSSSFFGPGIWAFIFGLAAIISGGISLPTGLHFAANFVLIVFGQKKDFESIWTLQYQSNVNPENLNTETVGNTIQLILFILTIVMMEWYIRRNKSKRQTKYGSST
jgi:membrane protease YdiL (CAAX protease family)